MTVGKIKVLTAIALGLGVAFGSGSAAFAHTGFVASTPTQGATVAELTEVTLTFSGELLDIGASVAIVDADGIDRAAAPVEIRSGGLAVTPVEDLGDGPYVVTWRVVSADGHPIDGALEFTVAGAAGEPSAAANSPDPSADAIPGDAEPSEGAPGSREPAASAQVDAGDSTLVLRIVAGFLLLVVARFVFSKIITKRRGSR